MQEIIQKTTEQIKPLLQQEAVDLAEEKLEEFHRWNPHRYEIAGVIYKGFKKKHKCTHTKNQAPLREALGQDVPASLHPDYNIGNHVFPDGRRKIWCLICGHVFTGKEAAKFWTTNTSTTSERILPAPDENAGTKAVYFDNTFVGEPKHVGSVEAVS